MMKKTIRKSSAQAKRTALKCERARRVVLRRLVGLSEMPMLRCYEDRKCYLKICSPNDKKLYALESELRRVINTTLK